MKTLFFYIIACLFLVCCSKKSNDLSMVDMFIDVLKEDSTENLESPKFTVDDISELLDYRNDELIISKFPRNPLSSLYMEDVEVGMFVLWTIESLRMEAIDDPNFYLFASLNPRVIRVSTSELLDQNNILPIVAEAYFEWWNSSLTTEEKLEMYPLEGMDLKWN